MKPTSILVFLLFSSLASGQSPASELKVALKDASQLTHGQAQHTRYLTLYPVPKDSRAEFLKVLTFWVNSLSREAELVRLRRVSETVFALEIDQLGWKADTWEKLLEVDPYFHTRARLKTGDRYQFWWRGGAYNGQALAAGRYEIACQNEQIVTIVAPWIDAQDALSLSTLTNSAIPIVRADWWLFQSGDEVNRVVGYYDWLGIKSLKDAQLLAGFDLELARTARKEIAAIVAESAVGLNNRQIFRFGTISGAWWETRDPDSSTDKKNALRNLDGDFDFDAMEIYYSLPNGLFGFVLANRAGELQASAPDNIAADHASTNNDRRVRTGVSCVRCHLEGLRPIDDWSRKVFRGEIGLGSPDREKAKRLKQLYLGPLQKELTRDRERYAETLKELTGLKPDELARSFASSWQRYESGSLLPADIGREVGLTEEQLLERLQRYLKSTGQVDLVLAGIVANPAVPIRREQFEEVFPLLMSLIEEKK